MTAPAFTLEYARPLTLGSEARSAFRLLFVVSILSGLCVAAAAFSLSGEPAAWVIHVAIFAVTIALAVLAGVRTAGVDGARREPLQLLFDLIATTGLLLIGIAPILFVSSGHVSLEHGVLVPSVVGIGYAFLACTTARHVILYRFLATLCRQVDRRGMARGLLALGWFKAIYEFIWLGCCAATLLLIALRQANGGVSGDPTVFFAFAALFGMFGYAAVWVWMMIAHGLLMRLAR